MFGCETLEETCSFYVTSQRDEHPAPSATCCPSQLDARSMLRFRCANILSPLAQSGVCPACLVPSPLSPLRAWKHKQRPSARSLAAKDLQRPPPLCTLRSKRLGTPQPHSCQPAPARGPGLTHLSPEPVLDTAQEWPLTLALPGHSDNCPAV